MPGDGREHRTPHGTFRVFETESPLLPPRRRCMWDAAVVPGFDDVDAAVDWGLGRAETVIVRTHGADRYWAGVRPEGGERGAWPPSADERRLIDEIHAAAVAAARKEARARASYVTQRQQWLSERSPTASERDPVHECLVLLADTGEVWIEFECLDLDGLLCGARRQGPAGLLGFGTPTVAIAAAAGRTALDPWVRAVGQVLERECQRRAGGRRSRIEVELGAGEMFHVTASANRQSILNHGLDWHRMGAACGISSNTEPDEEAIFLCRGDRDVDRIKAMSPWTADVWAARVNGLWLENGPNGWTMIAQPLSPERLTLVESLVPAGRNL